MTRLKRFVSSCRSRLDTVVALPLAAVALICVSTPAARANPLEMGAVDFPIEPSSIITALVVAAAGILILTVSATVGFLLIKFLPEKLIRAIR